MAEKGDERHHTNPSLRETLVSTEGAQRQKEPDPLSWNRSRRMSSPGSSSRFIIFFYGFMLCVVCSTLMTHMKH